jgi:hypothetical protein
MVGNNLLWWRIPVFCLLCHSIGHFKKKKNPILKLPTKE